jgi:5-methylcytosine-specific restriction protein A
MQTSKQLIQGNVYTREQLSQIFHITDATLNTGVFRPSGYQSIWLFVTEQQTNDRPQLHDRLAGDILYWDGQQQGRTDKLVIEHNANGCELLVFYRKNRNEFPNYGFKYEGAFQYVNHSGSHPTHFILQRIDQVLRTVEKDIEALQLEETYIEGKLQSVLVNKHERNPNLRAAAIEIHGTRCQVCNFSFAETYGILGKDFIEVHHLYPVSSYQGEINVDPTKDMAVVCSNCHRMIHRNPKHPLSLNELRQIVLSNH